MQGAIIPRFVPYQAVANHTPELSLGNMWLPEEFDPNSLVVNIHALQRVMWVAGLSQLAVSSHLSEPGRADGQSEVAHRWSRLASLAMTGQEVPRQPLVQAEITREVEDSHLIGQVKAHLSINASERDRRIKASGVPFDTLNPLAQATYLDRAIRRGLIRASHQANASFHDMAWNVNIYGVDTPFEVAHHNLTPALGMLGLGALGRLVAGVARIKHFNEKLEAENSDKRYELQDIRKSTIAFGAPDRHAVAVGVAGVSRFVKASANI